MRRTILAALAAALTLGIASGAPASATDPNASPTPMIETPLSVKDSVRADVVRVHLMGDVRRAVGLRSIAREADAFLPNVRISMRGTCAARPRSVCVRVRVGDFGDNGAYADVLAWPGQPTRTRVMRFNTRYDHPRPAALAAHEFAHVLGMGHHQRVGVCGSTPDALHFSAIERRTLRRVYTADGIAVRREEQSRMALTEGRVRLHAGGAS